MASSNTDGSSSEDWSLKTRSLVDATNNDLRARGHKASLNIDRGRFYIRGTFPERGRIRIYTGVKESIKGVALAETRLLDLLAAVKSTGTIPDPLPWANKKSDNEGYPKVKVREAIAKLKKEFFDVTSGNPKSRSNTWKTMQYGLDKLDPGAYVTTDYLMAQVIDKSIDPVTGKIRINQRLKLKQYFKRLGKIINLPDIGKIDKIEIVYEPKVRDIPDHGDLLEVAESLRDHPKYGWITAAVVIFGCRPSEVFSLVPKENGTAKVFNIKRKKGLPEWKTAMALPTTYVKKLNLLDISKPLEFKNPIDFDPTATKYLTDSWASWLDKKYPGLNLYDLRHSWAKRSIDEGVPSGLAAKCLGHSIKVFEDTYLRTVNELDVANFVKKNL